MYLMHAACSLQTNHTIVIRASFLFRMLYSKHAIASCMELSMQARCPEGMLLTVKMRNLCAYLNVESSKHKSIHEARLKTQFRNMQHFLISNSLNSSEL
jgi:hypothetical protein